MPGTPHGAAGDKAVAERAVVMRAMGADRKQLRSAAHKQHLLVAHVADELAVDEIGCSHTLCQIRTRRRRLFLSHQNLLTLKQSC